MAPTPEDRDIAARTALAESSDPAVQARIAREILASDDPSSFALERGRYKSWDNPRGASGLDTRKVAQLVDRTTTYASPPALKPGSILEQFGFSADGTPKAGTTKTIAPTDHEPGSVLKMFGHDINAPGEPEKSAEPLPPGAASYITVPGSGAKRYLDASGNFIDVQQPAGPTPTRQFFSELPRRGEIPPDITPFGPAARQFAGELPGRTGAAISEAFKGSSALAGGGIEDIRGRRYFPTTPALDPRTWTGGGLLKTAGGLLGMGLSPLAGPINVAGQEIDKLTGVPGTGEKAAMFLPVPKGLSAANELRPSVQAVNRLVEDIGEKNIKSVVNRLDQNPSLAVMDVAPGVQSRAMAVASGEPSAGQTLLFNEAERRVAERRGQTTHAFESTIGPAPDTVALLDKMKQDARDVGAQQIQPALAAAKPVDTSKVIAAIDAKLKPGITATATPGTAVAQGPVEQRLVEIRKELTDGKSFVTDPQRLHEVQSELARETRDLAVSTVGTEKRVGYAVSNIRNQLVDAIDASAGGKYKPGLAAYRDEMDVQRAFDRGQSITSGARTGNPGLENRPEAWAKWVGHASEKELEAARLGARVVIDNHIGTIKQAGRAGADIPDAPFTRAKLELLFGKPETDRLVQLLADEKAKAQSNVLLTGQSKTARTQATQATTAPRKIERLGEIANRNALLLGADVMQGMQTGYYGALTGVKYGAALAQQTGQRLSRAHQIARNNAYAHIASTVNPQERQTIRNALAQRASMVPSSVSKGTGKLVNRLAIAAPPAALLNAANARQ